MNDQKIIFGYPPLPIKTRNIEKVKLINFVECLIFLIDIFLLMEYNLFSQNTQNPFEQ